MFYYLHYMSKQPEKFFLDPKDRKQILYEALRKAFIEGLPDRDICQMYRLKVNTFRSAKRDFNRTLKNDEDPARSFFVPAKVGKREKHDPPLVKKIIGLRLKLLSLPEIKAILSGQGIHTSLWRIDKILKAHNFPPLPRRTQQVKQHITVPEDLKAPEAYPLRFPSAQVFQSLNGSIFLVCPVLKSLQIEALISEAGYPQTAQISHLSAILSFLALKLMNTKRLSHSNDYGLDRGLGLFAGLNVLPKNAWFASYSYRVTREMNKRFLRALHRQVEKIVPGCGDFNLDFTTIPHWGDASVLERNWSGTRHTALKSVLALLVQEQDSGFLKDGDAEIRATNKAEAILEFIDFYKAGNGKINCLIFDSKFTIYKQLNQLNKDNIKFLTLRRRSEKMITAIENMDKKNWQRIRLTKNFRRKHRNLLVYEHQITLRDYEGTLREIVVTNNGRERPTFLITNDFDIKLQEAILKYAKRWLVEQGISEQVEFYHLNRLNSSIVVKVDFDLTMSILADTVYKLFSREIPGFENKKAESIYRWLINNYAQVEITEEEKSIKITLNKKVHLAALCETAWFNQKVQLPWLGGYWVEFQIGSTL